MQPVFLPVLDANMTHGRIVAWHKAEGDRVEAGEPLFEVETDKVNVEVEAECTGVLRKVAVAAGERVAVLTVVAFIGADGEPVPPPQQWASLAPRPCDESAATTPAADTLAVRTAAGRIPASPAARRLARERGIAIESVRPSGGRGEVTRGDVERACAAAAATAGAGTGDIDPSFLALLRRDAEAFRALSSDTKIRLYRQHGARIGDGARIDSGAIVIAAHIDIGARSVIGADSTVECERLRLGRLSVFGRRARINCRSLEIGDALWARDDIVIGGGGAQEAGARLRAGDACFFGEGAYLNAGEPITLGDEVCIGSRAMLFTHSHWQSILRGHLSRFGPIEIGDHVFIGNNAFVFPGVRIGAGATVMVGSFVGAHVPPAVFVGGVPARILRHITPPTRAEQASIMRREMEALAAVLAAHGLAGVRRDEGAAAVIEIEGGSIRFEPTWPAAATPEGRCIVLTFADNGVGPLPAGVTVFDLAGGRVIGSQDELSDEVREFCRRRGIRFRPFAWRYRTGHFEGDVFRARGG